MTAAPVSVIVVSRDRPRLLRRCVKSLAQQYYPNFEIIVVCDPDSGEELRAAGYKDRLKIAEYDTANISVARNMGLSVASGDIVAFIDDDSAAEPTWLNHLVEPIAKGHAVAAGGYVRGRNGISFQWRARDVRPNGWSEPLLIEGSEPVCVTTEPALGVKTEGTNMAFSRSKIMAMGGFDPAFQFYLDETDVNMRLANEHAVTAIVPLAQVHHGFAQSSRRTAFRAPRSLFHEGRSLCIYLRKHCATEQHDMTIRAEREHQRRRVLDYMVAGRIDPVKVRSLMQSFDQGVAEGMAAKLTEPAPVVSANLPFLKFDADPAELGHTALVARWYNFKKVVARAMSLRNAGHRVTIFRYSLTAVFHRVCFRDDGIWLQSGGLFGRSDRNDPLFRLTRKKLRTDRELSRLRGLRELLPKK
ncbi:hypothetical protein BVC71_07350 [Marivivens niveibacter]|uniref:Glycosyltransferase 2-like domain-containing protein n=1 Tax=Marivivens niveibacter TaxID=1930667 RepID=A0A251WZS9_9RHOB|nr:glycosyltransferase family A protein [Marivivens niveibacter]OUD09645.1 hypothetical protein BVC71_07350 [Marivivens niveibacter]